MPFSPALVLLALILLAVPFASAVAGDAPAAPPPGTRIKLTLGTLFIPDGVKPAADGMEVLVHLKGQGTGAESSFVASGRPGVLVWFWDPGLSKVYSTHFAEGKALQVLLDETSAQLKQRNLGDGTLRRVTVASFSAGYAAVRECLKQEALFKRIDALVLSDTIYAGFIGDAAERKVNPADMEPFLKFAREAVEGRKTMVLAHSSEPVPNYASTTETANYLLEQLKLTRLPSRHALADWGDGLMLTSWAFRGNFTVYAFGPADGISHGLFLKHIEKFYRLLPDERLYSRLVAILGKPNDDSAVSQLRKEYLLDEITKGSTGGFSGELERNGFSIHYDNNKISRIHIRINNEPDFPDGKNWATFSEPLPGGLVKTDAPKDVTRKLGLPRRSNQSTYLTYEYENPNLEVKFFKETGILVELILESPRN